MSAYLTVHRCTRIVVTEYDASNANSVSLTLKTRDRGHAEEDILQVTLFNLPSSQAIALIALFGAPDLRSRHFDNKEAEEEGEHPF